MMIIIIINIDWADVTEWYSDADNNHLPVKSPKCSSRHESHLSPVTLARHTQVPVTSSHSGLIEPNRLQLHAVCIYRRHTHAHTHTHTRQQCAIYNQQHNHDYFYTV